MSHAPYRALHAVQARLQRINSDLRYTAQHEGEVATEDFDAAPCFQPGLSMVKEVSCLCVDERRGVLWVGDKEGWVTGDAESKGSIYEAQQEGCFLCFSPHPPAQRCTRFYLPSPVTTATPAQQQLSHDANFERLHFGLPSRTPQASTSRTALRSLLRRDRWCTAGRRTAWAM
jgi:hypothetical protein